MQIFIYLLKVMLSCSTYSKIAIYLVKQYLEHDVYVTFSLSLDITAHNTFILCHIKRYTSKGRWDLTLRFDVQIMFAFERSRLVMT